MTVTEALEKLKTYEQTSFALGHAMAFEGICTESVGVHHITAGFKVAAVQRNNLIRMGQAPRFRQFTGF